MSASDNTQVTFAELRTLVPEFKPFNQGAATAALATAAQKRKQTPEARTTGDAAPASLAAWVAGWQSRYPARLTYPRIALYAGIQPLANQTDALARTRQRIAAITDGEAPVHALAAKLDADLRLYEVGTDTPPGDPRFGAAQDPIGAARATAFGLMAVDDTTDILALAAIAPGGAATAALIGTLVYHGRVADWADEQHQEALHQAIGQPAAATDAFDLAAAIAGPDVCALMGAIMAARLAGIPVILDGPLPLAAAALIAFLVPGGADHVRWGQNDRCNVSQKLADALGLTPLIDEKTFGRSDGEGDGAVRAIARLRVDLAPYLL